MVFHFPLQNTMCIQSGGCVALTTLLIVFLSLTASAPTFRKVSGDVEDEYFFEYLVTMTNQFQAKHPHLILPSLPEYMKAPDRRQYMLPVILLWDPPGQYPDLFPGGISCPHHPDSTLKPSRWTNQKHYPPRMIHHMGQNVFVIARQYVCDSPRCTFLSTSEPFINSLPEIINVPFRLLYRSGVTSHLYDCVISWVNAGTKLETIEKSLADNIALEHHRVKKQFWLHVEWYREKHCQNFDISAIREPEHSILDIPSDDMIREIVLIYHRENLQFFTEEMQKVKAKWMSCDHTFKVAGTFY